MRLFYFVLILTTAALVGCKQKPKNVFEKGTLSDGSVIPEKYARLEVPTEVDLGVFDLDHIVKSQIVKFRNTGNDTLYVLAAMPECDCTEVELLDSAIAPQAMGRVRASLNLNDYPADTIRKDFGIISNNYGERVVRVTLVGVRQ